MSRLQKYHALLLQADTHIGTSGTAPNVTKIGSNFTVGALVKNASPASIAYPDGKPTKDKTSLSDSCCFLYSNATARQCAQRNAMSALVEREVSLLWE